MPYAVERGVEDLEALIDAAGGSAFACGHSSGAVLALGAARLLPTKITKLVPYEPPFIIDDTHAPAPERFAARLDELVAAGHWSDAVESWIAFMGTPAEMLAPARAGGRALEALLRDTLHTRRMRLRYVGSKISLNCT